MLFAPLISLLSPITAALLPQYYSAETSGNMVLIQKMPAREVPLDVDGYPTTPPELVLEQVHVYARHGTLSRSFVTT